QSRPIWRIIGGDTTRGRDGVIAGPFVGPRIPPGLSWTGLLPRGAPPRAGGPPRGVAPRTARGVRAAGGAPPRPWKRGEGGGRESRARPARPADRPAAGRGA